MDYGGLQVWDGSIVIVPVNRDRVRRAVDAMTLWQSLGSLRTEPNLRAFEDYGKFLEALADKELEIAVDSPPRLNGVRITTESVRA